MIEVWDSVMQRWRTVPAPTTTDRWVRYTTRDVTVVAPPQSTVRTVVR